MSQQKFPGYQYMVSQDDCEAIKRRHAEIMKFRECDESECVIEDLKPTPQWERERRGYRPMCTYTLRWTTYKGWQVYMQHTGCFAC